VEPINDQEKEDMLNMNQIDRILEPQREEFGSSEFSEGWKNTRTFISNNFIQ